MSIYPARPRHLALVIATGVSLALIFLVASCNEDIKPGTGEAFYELTRLGANEIADGEKYSDFDTLCQVEMKTRIVSVSPVFWSQYQNRIACTLEFDNHYRFRGVEVTLLEGYRHYLTVRISGGHEMKMTAVGPGKIEGDFRVTSMVVFLDDTHNLTDHTGQWAEGWLDELDDGSGHEWTTVGSAYPQGNASQTR